MGDASLSFAAKAALPAGASLKQLSSLECKARLRKQLRQTRNQINAKPRLEFSRKATARLARQFFFLRARSIALYAAANGEVATSFLVNAKRRPRKRCFLPVLHPFAGNRLWFLRWDEQTKLTTNRFGILEPKARGVPRKPQQLDLVVVPLLGFDKRGGRLGMGGGFYDRTFAFRLHHERWQRPLLVGLAFACQEIAYIPRNSWDLQLDYVVTNTALYRCKGPVS